MRIRSKKVISITLVMLMVLVGLNGLYVGNEKAYAADGFAGGTGTMEDPYQIATAAQLDKIRDFLGDSDNYHYFELIHDIDLAEYLSVGGAGYNDGAGWESIGGEHYQMFYGSLDGNGYRIANLYINRSPIDTTFVGFGFFGYTSPNSEISNINLDTINVTGGYEVTGGLIGLNKGTINNSSVTGVVYGNSTVGGLAGTNFEGTISNSHAAVIVNGLGTVGGLVGQNEGTINTSKATGSVNGGSEVGGLVGNNYVEISNSYATGSVNGLYSNVGGLVGQNIKDWTDQHIGLITNSYATGNVNGNGGTEVGGLVGQNNYDTYNGTITNSYYDSETTVQPMGDTGKGVGESTANMQTTSTFMGWDFDSVWYMLSDQYPQLWAFTTLSPGTDNGTTRLNNVAPGMEYSLDGVHYTAIASNSVDNIHVNVGDTISVRVVGTSPISPKALTVDSTNRKPALVSTAAIAGVTAPVTGATPVTTVTETTYYTGTVAWSSSPVTFAASTEYTATITITPKVGYTLTGVAADFFTVAGATTTNDANSGVVTAVFPVTASSNANLSGLTLSSGTLDPVFSSGETSYQVNVANDISSFAVTANVVDSNATVKVNGTAVTSGSPSDPIHLDVGSNVITVVVAAEDGTTTQTYTITVTRAPNSNAMLSGLSVTPGTLTFTPSNINYTVNVENSISSLDVSITKGDPTQTVTVTGAVYQALNGSVYDYLAQNLTVGNNPIDIQVTAQDGSTSTYKIIVNRAEPTEMQYNLDPDQRTLSLLGGASLTLPDGLVIPDGAVLTVSLSDAEPSEDVKLAKAGQVLSFDFDNITIDQPVEITMGYDAEQDASKLAIFYYNELSGKWEYTPSQADDNGVTVSVSHFSTYGVLSDTASPNGVSVALNDASVNSISLDLAASDDSGIAQYMIYRDGAKIGETELETYVDEGLASSHDYAYTVKAVDYLGNASDFSEVLLATTDSQDNDSDAPSDGTPAPSGQTRLPSTTDDNTEEPIATTDASEQNGQTVITATIDSDKLTEKLANAGDNAVVTVPVTDDSDKVSAILTGASIQAMVQNGAVLNLQTPIGSYKLPASEVKVELLAALLGGPSSLADLTIQVDIAKSDDAKVELLANAANKEQFTVVVPPVDFTVTAKLGDKSVTVDTFSSFVEREIPIPDGVDASKITSAVVLNADGTTRAVPMKIVTREGKKVAVINSLTNSTYSLVSHSVTFSDVANHWAKNTVNDMGSRMIVSGTGNGNFSPDQDITRAEFSAIIIRGLGLKLEEGPSDFSDVQQTAWYSSAIKTAHAYGLIDGYENGTFQPNEKITREQAMVIIAKAMAITGLKDQLAVQSPDTTLLPYTDAAQASSWAIDGIADCVQAGIVSGKTDSQLAPNDKMTRAEVASIVQQLLQKSNLI